MTGAIPGTPARPPAEAGAGLPLHTDSLRRACLYPKLFRSASVEKKKAAQGRGGGPHNVLYWHAILERHSIRTPPPPML